MNQAYRWFGVGVGLAALPVVPQCECGTGGRQAVPLHLMQPRSPAFATIVGGQAQGERRPAPAGVGPGLSPELAAREGGGAVAAVSDRRTAAAVSDRRTGAAVSDRRRRSEIDATMTAVGTPPLQRAAVGVAPDQIGTGREPPSRPPAWIVWNGLNLRNVPSGDRRLPKSGVCASRRFTLRQPAIRS